MITNGIQTWPRITLTEKHRDDYVQYELASYVRLKFSNKWYKVLITEKARLHTSRTKEHALILKLDLYRMFIVHAHDIIHTYIPKESDMDDLQMEESERLIIKNKYDNNRINPFDLLGL